MTDSPILTRHAKILIHNGRCAKIYPVTPPHSICILCGDASGNGNYLLTFEDITIAAQGVCVPDSSFSEKIKTTFSFDVNDIEGMAVSWGSYTEPYHWVHDPPVPEWVHRLMIDESGDSWVQADVDANSGYCNWSGFIWPVTGEQLAFPGSDDCRIDEGGDSDGVSWSVADFAVDIWRSSTIWHIHARFRTYATIDGSPSYPTSAVEVFVASCDTSTDSPEWTNERTEGLYYGGSASIVPICDSWVDAAHWHQHATQNGPYESDDRWIQGDYGWLA